MELPLGLKKSNYANKKSPNFQALKTEKTYKMVHQNEI